LICHCPHSAPIYLLFFHITEAHPFAAGFFRAVVAFLAEVGGISHANEDRLFRFHTIGAVLLICQFFAKKSSAWWVAKESSLNKFANLAKTCHAGKYERCRCARAENAHGSGGAGVERISTRTVFVSEAKAMGRGGISLVSRLSGVSRQTLTGGVKELDDPDSGMMEPGRSRRRGGGNKPVWVKQPGLLEALAGLVSAHTKGDPMRPLLWTNKSLRNLAQGLAGQGYEVCHRVVGEMLKRLGYGLQADKKHWPSRPRPLTATRSSST
jgi:hypothetical protein